MIWWLIFQLKNMGRLRYYNNHPNLQLYNNNNLLLLFLFPLLFTLLLLFLLLILPLLHIQQSPMFPKLPFYVHPFEMSHCRRILRSPHRSS